MIRRVLKEMRETWPYWVSLIALWPLLSAGGLVVAWSHGLFGQVPGPKPSLSPRELISAYSSSREVLKIALEYLALIHYLVFLLIAVSLFGAEFKHQTMNRLLAQPVSRRRIWFEKALAYLLIVLAVLVCEWFVGGGSLPELGRKYCQMVASQQGLLVAQGWLVIPWHPTTSCALCLLSVAVLALANGTLASLFLRQTHTAFWAALVFPVVVFLILAAGDTLVLNTVFGVSVSAWVQNWYHFRLNLLSIDLFLFDIGAALWFAVVYPLAWLKFKRLEV